MRAIDLNLIGLSADERWELYQDAEDMGFLDGCPEIPRPFGDPLTMLNQAGFGKLMKLMTIAMDESTPQPERDVACYAWHVWRERVDIWEMTPIIWTGEGKYDPHWQAKMDTVGAGTVLYNTFISGLELERYFLNPWIRCSAWIEFQNLEQMLNFRIKGEKGAKGFYKYVRQPMQWWMNQKVSKGLNYVDTYGLTSVPGGPEGLSYIGPVSGLAPSMTGMMPTAEWKSVHEIDPEIGCFGYEVLGEDWEFWGSVEDRVPVGIVQGRAKCFSWEEFWWRRDEAGMLIWLGRAMKNRALVEPLGGSYGSGCVARLGVSPRAMWSIEKKVLCRLNVKINTMANGIIGGLGENLNRNIRLADPKWAG